MADPSAYFSDAWLNFPYGNSSTNLDTSPTAQQPQQEQQSESAKEIRDITNRLIVVEAMLKWVKEGQIELLNRSASIDVQMKSLKACMEQLTWMVKRDIAGDSSSSYSGEDESSADEMDNFTNAVSGLNKYF
ncbi:hypothetical protein S7711_11510 [Stachybotrys chartarum IBT 7711]|uniref:Uncharacterized protein n=1 Tax=Stachybotrys chartarum (strain CBS 109288 / IBT 7711) TaxID=1280523 RepID=A0A084B950_STACB|nr:hypothetical protein S7711_11510 [Stachybotrys chartarum IBT 7711]